MFSNLGWMGIRKTPCCCPQISRNLLKTPCTWVMPSFLHAIRFCQLNWSLLIIFKKKCIPCMSTLRLIVDIYESKSGKNRSRQQKLGQSWISGSCLYLAHNPCPWRIYHRCIGPCPSQTAHAPSSRGHRDESG